jgi:hypothetical protein
MCAGEHDEVGAKAEWRRHGCADWLRHGPVRSQASALPKEVQVQMQTRRPLKSGAIAATTQPRLHPTHNVRPDNPACCSSHQRICARGSAARNPQTRPAVVKNTSRHMESRQAAIGPAIPLVDARVRGRADAKEPRPVSFCCRHVSSAASPSMHASSSP